MLQVTETARLPGLRVPAHRGRRNMTGTDRWGHPLGCPAMLGRRFPLHPEDSHAVGSPCNPTLSMRTEGAAPTKPTLVQCSFS